jgi:hypothetical protein
VLGLYLPKCLIVRGPCIELKIVGWTRSNVLKRVSILFYKRENVYVLTFLILALSALLAMKDMIASNKLVYERQESSCLLRRKIFCLAAMSGWRFISVFQKLPVWQRLHDSS